MPKSEIMAEFPGITADILEHWWPERPEEEEHRYSRAARVEAKVRSLGHETDLRVAAVGHGTFGAVLMSSILGAPPCGYTRFSQNNCCVSILELRPGRAKLVRSNDVSHLSPDLLT
jgi:broad specificity phosphatase PhoE